MARYEASSIEFGEKLQSDLIKRKKEEARDQEKFAKKITAANFVVKGANEFLKNRVDTFNTSLLDEKAFLSTAQKNAANILATKTKLDKDNISNYDYVSGSIANSWRNSIESNVEGIMVQTMAGNEIKEIPAYDVPLATLKKLKNFKVGNKKYATYEDMVNEQVALFEETLNHARNVPSDSTGVQTYLNTYSKKELPNNILGAITRPVKRILRGETRETLQDKVNKSTTETLNDPLFNSFTQFAGTFEAYNKAFPNASTDFIQEYSDNLTRDIQGNIVDKKLKKIVKSSSSKIELKSVSSDNPETNRRETRIIAQPTITTTYVDNTVGITVDTESQKEIVSGAQLLVTLNAPLLNSFNATLNSFGREQWAVYQKNNNKSVHSNPVAEFSKFVESGIQGAGTEANKYLTGELDVSKILESFLAGGSKDFTSLVTPPVQMSDESDEDFATRSAEDNKKSQELIEDTFRNITEPLQNLSNILDLQLRN